MTDHRLQQLYYSARQSAHLAADRLAMPAVRAKAERQVGQALDLIIMECDAHQAGLVAWAMDNGYPDWETVLRYGDRPVNK